MLLPYFLLVLQAGQADTIRLAEETCSTCRIALEHVVTLGDEDGPGAITFGAGISVDARGRYWLGHAGAPAQVVIFSPQGQLLRTVGRGGGGPGEYRRIWRISPYPNGMVLWDDFAKRSTVLDLDFNVVDTRPAPETPESVVLWSDLKGIMSAIVPTRDLIGFALHEIDQRGRRIRSIGSSTLPYRESMRELFLRTVTPSLSGRTYWASHRLEYAFALCEFGAKACRLYIRPVSWFPRPRWGENPDMGSAPPTPRLRAVSQDDPRHLWAITWVADPQWRSALEQATRSEYRVTDFNKYYDTIVERIDIERGRVVASARVDVVLWDFAAPGLTWWRNEDALGIPRLEVVRLRMQDNP